MGLKIRLKKYKGAEQVVYIIFMLIPVMQLLNSFVIFSNGESNLGKIFRLITLLIMLQMCSRIFSAKGFLIISGLGMACALTAVIDFYRGINLGLAEWLNSILKLLSPIIYFFCLKGLYEKQRITKGVIESILSFWAWFMSLSMIIPYIAGAGYSNYHGYGYRGFFYENDSYNITTCCLLAIFLNKAVNEKKKKCYIVSGLLAISVVLTGSKVALIYGVIILIYVLLFPQKMSVRNLLKPLVTIVFLCVALIIIMHENSLVRQQIEYYLGIYSYSRTAYGDTPIAILTNGRSKKLLYCINHLWSSNDILDVLFGIGGYGTEMDFWDTYVKMGLIPIIIILGLCLAVIHKCRSAKNMKIISFSLLLILIYAAVAGHVVDSSFTCGLIAMLVFLIYTNKKTEMNIYENIRDCDPCIQQGKWDNSIT